MTKVRTIEVTIAVTTELTVIANCQYSSHQKTHAREYCPYTDRIASAGKKIQKKKRKEMLNKDQLNTTYYKMIMSCTYIFR